MIRVLIALIVLMLIAAFTGVLSHPRFSSKVFKTNGGWGYDIMASNKIVIHQEEVPCIQERKSFSTKTQAEEAADLIITKLKAKQFPMLTKFEVMQILSHSN